MSYTFDPSFGRGLVLGALWAHPIEKTDPSTGNSTVGRKKEFTDVNAKTGVLLSNEVVTCVALRNTTAAAVLPGTNQTLSGYVGVVDEYVKSTGVPVGEVFWLVINGPTQQPLGTRVNLMTNGTPVPRLLVVDGKEVPENTDTNPSVRVVFEEAEGETADAAATTPDATATPTTEPVVAPVAETVPVDPTVTP
jgi:hypothetical protein